MTVSDKMIDVVARFKPRILFAYLFGSSGTHLQGPLSDVDIAVHFNETDTSRLLDHKLNLYAEASRALKRNDIDIVMLNTCANHMLLYEIMIRGRLIYDAEPGIRAVFEQKTLHAAIDFLEQRERIFA